MFAALQQDNAEDDDDDDVMAENTEQPKPKPNSFASEHAASNPVTSDPASVDEDDEIT